MRGDLDKIIARIPFLFMFQSSSTERAMRRSVTDITELDQGNAVETTPGPEVPESDKRRTRHGVAERHLHHPDRGGTIRAIEFRENKEPIKVASLQEAFRQARDEMDARIVGRFGKDGLFPMNKHAPEHSLEEVEGGTAQVLETVNKSLVEFYGSEEKARQDPAYSSVESRLFASLLARTHDSVQNHILINDPNGNEVMQRYRGAEGADVSEQVGDPKTGNRAAVLDAEMNQFKLHGNERDSANELVAHLKRYQYQDGKPVFSEEKLATIRPDIAATYPNFSFSPDTGLKVFQPYLDAKINPNLTITGFALAHADLRFLLAQKGSKGFEDGGDAELRETKPWIFKMAEAGIEGAPEKNVRQAVHEILGWFDTQVSFAKWQKTLIEESINTDETIKRSPAAEKIRENLRGLFQLAPGASFDQNIEQTKARAARMREQYKALLDSPQVMDSAARVQVSKLIGEIAG